jgi:hypothetical protein
MRIQTRLCDSVNWTHVGRIACASPPGCPFYLSDCVTNVLANSYTIFIKFGMNNLPLICYIYPLLICDLGAFVTHSLL